MTTSFLDVSVHLLTHGFRLRFRAHGESMYPAIQDGDIITVQPFTESKVKLGDIVLYQGTSGPVVHRLEYKQTNDEFLLRGDRSIECDKPVPSREILGKVVLIERNGHFIKPRRWKARLLVFLRFLLRRQALRNTPMFDF